MDQIVADAHLGLSRAAPLFANLDQTVRVGKRTYDLYYDGSQLQTVAWREHGASYWVHNTLTDAVDNGELLAIAEQTVPIAGVLPTRDRTGAESRRPLDLRRAVVPTRTTPAATQTTIQTVGSIGGVVALVALPLLMFGLVRRRFALRRLRTALTELEDRGAHLQAAVEATGGPGR